jgi:hypothetical protein
MEGERNYVNGSKLSGEKWAVVKSDDKWVVIGICIMQGRKKKKECFQFSVDIKQRNK